MTLKEKVQSVYDKGYNMIDTFKQVQNDFSSYSTFIKFFQKNCISRTKSINSTLARKKQKHEKSFNVKI